jgi:hypothetical protein
VGAVLGLFAYRGCHSDRFRRAVEQCSDSIRLGCSGEVTLAANLRHTVFESRFLEADSHFALDKKQHSFSEMQLGDAGAARLQRVA